MPKRSKRPQRKDSLPMASSGVLVLPNGKTIDLALARERMVELTAHRGLSTERQRRYLERQQQEIDTVRAAVELKKQGFSVSRIAEILSRERNDVYKWLKGELFPTYFVGPITFRRFQGRRKKIDWKKVLSSPEKRAKLAYCFGALFGNLSSTTDAGELRTQFSATLNSHDFAKKLQDYLFDVSGTKPNLKRKKAAPSKATPKRTPLSYLTLTSVDFVQFMNRHTIDQSRPPKEVVRTREDLRQFVKGYWDSRGHVEKNGTVYLRLMEPQIRTPIIAYLAAEGIEFVKGHELDLEVIRVRSSSRKRFSEKIGFTDREKQQRLNLVTR